MSGSIAVRELMQMVCAAALFAGCSLIVDSKLEDEGPDDAGAPSVSLTLEPPVITPGQIPTAYIAVENFRLAQTRIGQLRFGSYRLSIAAGAAPEPVEIYQGYEQTLPLPLKGVLPSGVYEVFAELLERGNPLIPPVTDSVELSVCNPAPGAPQPSDACQQIAPDVCKPQDGCVPEPMGACRTSVECSFDSPEPCVGFTRIEPLPVASGDQLYLQVEVGGAVILIDPASPSMPPPGRSDPLYGFLQLALVPLTADADPFELAMGADLETWIPVDLLPGTYGLHVFLQGKDAAVRSVLAENCWPIMVVGMREEAQPTAKPSSE